MTAIYQPLHRVSTDDLDAWKYGERIVVVHRNKYADKHLSVSNYLYTFNLIWKTYAGAPTKLLGRLFGAYTTNTLGFFPEFAYNIWFQKRYRPAINNIHAPEGFSHVVSC